MEYAQLAVAEEASQQKRVADDSESRIPDDYIPLQEVPDRPPPILELGDSFLGNDPIRRGFELPTGAVWNPSLQVYGTLRSALQGVNTRMAAALPYIDCTWTFCQEKLEIGIVRPSEWASRLDIFGNLQLSGTERVLVGFRPFDDRRRYSGYVFAPRPDRGFEKVFHAPPETLFFEGDFGEIFPDLDAEDRYPLDFGFAVGRQQIRAQGGLLLDDTLDAVGIARNTLRPSNISNFRLTGVYAWSNVDRSGARDDTAHLGLLQGELDTPLSTINFDFAYVNGGKWRGDGFFGGISFNQRVWQVNSILRANASVPLDYENAFTMRGVLLSAELSATIPGTHHFVYLNGFWAINEFTGAARSPDAGGPAAFTGILFAAPALGKLGSPLDSSTQRAVGGAVGAQFFLWGIRRQLVLEVGGRTDTDHSHQTAGAVGLRFQQAIGQRVVFQLDGFGVRREKRRASYGGRVELLLKL